MHQKNIALINPYCRNDRRVTPPLGLGYLASSLSAAGYKAHILDGLKEKLSNMDILTFLQKNGIRIAGISCMSDSFQDVANLARFLKKNGITVIVGGVHPTFMPYQTLVETGADYVVCGEGEIAFKELLDALSIPPPPPVLPQGVYSLRELKDEQTPFIKAVSVANLDALPFPDWEQMRPRSYPYAPFGIFIKKFPVAYILSSRGCPYLCKFCAGSNFYDRKVRFRSPENIVSEIKMLVDKYGVKEISFLDDNLTLNRNHIESICRLIIEKNIKAAFSCPNGIRADKIDDNLAKLMKKAGFYYCALGIESANEEILKTIKKGETLETITNAVRILKKNKITTQGFFILGFPGETKETIQETIRYALDSGLDRANFNILEIMPGADFWPELHKISTPHFNGGAFVEPSYVPDGLTPAELRKAQTSATRQFFLRIPILLKLLPFFHIRQLLYVIKATLMYAGSNKVKYEE